MTMSLEQRLAEARARFGHAYEQLIADVLEAARDASVEALERAFAETRAAPRFVDALQGDARTMTSVPRRPAAAVTAVTRAVMNRVLAHVRAVPGSHIGQLSESLAMPEAVVRRHLRQLAAEDAIRIEGALGPCFGRPRQTFFAIEPGAVGAEAVAGSAGVSA